MDARFAASTRVGLAEVSFDAVVGYEEQGGAGGGADNCGTDACVDAFETAGLEEAGAGLETRF